MCIGKENSPLDHIYIPQEEEVVENATRVEDCAKYYHFQQQEGSKQVVNKPILQQEDSEATIREEGLQDNFDENLEKCNKELCDTGWEEVLKASNCVGSHVTEQFDVLQVFVQDGQALINNIAPNQILMMGGNKLHHKVKMNTSTNPINKDKCESIFNKLTISTRFKQRGSPLVWQDNSSQKHAYEDFLVVELLLNIATLTSMI